MTDIENVQVEETPSGDVDVAVAEEMIPKSVVSKIVERERNKAIEKTERKYMEQLAAQQQEQAPVAQQPQGQQVGLGGMAQMSQSDIERLIAEQAPQALMQHVNQLKTQHTVDTFVNKVKAAEQQYPGLQQELGNLNFEDPRMGKFVEMVNGLENTGEIMKEVLDHPHKLSQILSDIHDQPYLAMKNLQKLSASIKQNEVAQAEEKQARDPMSSLKPSPKAGIDNGDMSVQDFRKMFRG